MSNIPRDTQFAGFAKALFDELPDVPNNPLDTRAYDAWSAVCEIIIAQRAYDLVDHTVCSINSMDFECQTNPYEEIPKSIPDLIEFPPESG